MTLIFAWGLVTSLIASVHGVLNLSFAEAMLAQFACLSFFGA